MKRNSGFTLIELLVVVMVLGILSAMAVAGLLRSRLAANEASAIASVRTVTTAQMTYAASCGRGFFATSLATLGVPPPGATAAFISPDLAGGPIVQKSGYQIQVAAAAGAQVGVNDCNGSPTGTSFYARAEPLTFGVTGTRSFATSAVANTIWMTLAGAAPAEPFGAPALPLQ